MTVAAASRVLRSSYERSKPWSGKNLEVASVRGRGRSGRVYLVRSRSLPENLQAKLALEGEPRVTQTALATDAPHHEALWQLYDQKPSKQKNKAERRLEAVNVYTTLVEAGVKKGEAQQLAAQQLGISAATLRGWLDLIKGVHRTDWLPALAPRWIGRTAVSDCSPEAWDFFKADYLRQERPAATACYDRLQRTATKHDWIVPSLDTLERRLRKEIPRPALILARQGEEALKRSYPSQKRDHSLFHALQAVNADGHKFDVFCRWPDGTVSRPVMVAWQDVYSGKLLSHRVDRTENSDSVRLSFGDLVERYGLPEHAYLDNGRSFAAKHLTGGSPTRYRFKVREEDPAGILTQMGLEVHWTSPYHGQAKPIERAFRDLAEYVSRHPAFAGAYTGNKIDSKPENYGSKAIPIDDFMVVLDAEIAAHNARLGRRSLVCNKRSLDQAFDESYTQAVIRKATAEQRRLWMLAAEGITASRADGSVNLLGNRYYSDALAGFAGKKLIVRFDPDALHGSIFAYTLDGRYIGEAECIQMTGFNDQRAARDRARLVKQNRQANQRILDNERRLDAARVAALIPEQQTSIRPETKVIQLARPAPVPTIDDADDVTTERDAAFARAVELLKKDGSQLL